MLLGAMTLFMYTTAPIEIKWKSDSQRDIRLQNIFVHVFFYLRKPRIKWNLADPSQKYFIFLLTS